MNAATLAGLKAIDTPTICNIIELFDVRPHNTGYADARLQAVYPTLPPMVGFASTATFQGAAADSRAEAYGLPAQIARMVEIDGPRVVVFQDLDTPSAAATFGEVMCTAYQAFGAVGLITSGTGRDLDQIVKLDFPVFTGGTICSHGYGRILEVHGTVQVGGLTVKPGELLHGDWNGIMTIPLSIAGEIPDVAAEYLKAEQIIIAPMRQPGVTLADLEAAVAEFEAVKAGLHARVSRRR